MASDTVTYKLELDTRKFSADIKKAEREFASAGKAAEEFGRSAGKTSKSMDSLHSEALKMNAAMDRGRGTTLKLGQGFRMLTPAISNTAMAFGVNSKAIMGFNSVAGIADVNFKQLRKSAIGFNTATLAGVGAAAALGYALGTLLRQISGVEKAADKAAASLWQMMFGGEMNAKGFRPEERAKFAGEAANAAAMMQIDQLNLAKRLAGEGLNSGQIRDILAGKEAPNAAEQYLLKMEEQAREQEIAAEKWKRAQEAAAKKTLEAFTAFQQMQHEMDQAYRETLREKLWLGGPMASMPGLGKLPGEGSLAGMDNMLPPGITRGQMNAALGRQAELDAGASFEKSQMARWSADTKEATNNTQQWVTALSMAAHAMSLLGVASDSGLGKALSATASGAAMGAAFGPLGAVIGGGIGLFSSLFGGGGKSKEQIEAERKQAEAERRRIQDAAKAMRSGSIDALGTTAPEFFSSRTILNADDARHQGTLFAAAWGQVVKEKGIVAAADAFKDAFSKMKADMESAGLEMPEWMKVISGQMGLADNEGYRAASSNAQNAAGFLGALGGSGGLSPEAFRAFEQEARAQFAAAEKAATEAGMDTADATNAGFSATNPLLKELLNQSILSGQTLSDDIQEMIDQAGIVPDVDMQQLDELRQIRAAVQRLAGFGGDGGDGPGDNHNPNPFDGLPEMNKGGRIERGDRGPAKDGGHPVIVHPGETVVPDSLADDFARNVLGSSGGAQPTVVVNAPLTIDTMGLGKNNVEQFTAQVRETVENGILQPGTPGYRRLTKLIKRLKGS